MIKNDDNQKITKVLKDLDFLNIESSIKVLKDDLIEVYL